MVRLKDQKNLSAALYVQQNSIDWNKLPLKDAIKSVKGNGKRQLAVFSTSVESLSQSNFSMRGQDLLHKILVSTVQSIAP
jgi:hypothetical protein